MARAEDEHDTVEHAVSSHPTPPTSSPRSPSEDLDEASKLSKGDDEHRHQLVVPFVLQTASTSTSSLLRSPLDGQPETPKVSVGEEEAAKRPSLLPTSTFLSPLSAGLQEAGQTTTTAVAVTTTATTAAASTTVGPSSPLDHVLIIGHGRFQRIVLACTTLAFFTAIVHALASTNLAKPVDHWCSPPAEYAFVSEDAWRNVSIPVHRDGSVTRRSQCHRYEPPFEHPAGNPDVVAPPENRSVVPCDAGWHYETGASSDNRSHHGAFGFKHDHSIVVEWDLVCDRGWIVSALTAAYMAGGVVGAPVAGIAADRIGRRPVLCIWLLLLLCSGTMLVFARNVAVFAALRFLLSAGASGVLVASHVLLFEVTDTEHRAPYCACAVAGATIAATVYTEIVYVYVRNWHAAQVAYIVPTCGLIVTVYLMEESPCWLLAVSEMRYAESVLVWAAGVNKIEPRLFKRRLSLLRVELNKQHEQLVMQQEPEGAIVSDHGDSIGFPSAGIDSAYYRQDRHCHFRT
ncbi:beta-alanine transporter-like [Dermacentor silvarum]|uniref:beta-alanine transporter-like n=1 Tax=Dermacentor silvarum TaxID=543639 RepID=UPI0021007295|nr:beta-alanine transporter-like [Dermacentor silvarum]